MWFGVAALTMQMIKEDPEFYQQWFKNINEPTDEEVRKYFKDIVFRVNDFQVENKN